jgi:RNA-binding protein
VRTRGDLKRRLRAEGHGLEPTAFVGRRGLEETVLEEIGQQLKRRGLVKVRIKGSAHKGDRDEEETIARDLADALGAELVERRGHTVLLYREGGRRAGRDGR